MSERRQQAWDEAQRRYATRDRQAGFASGAAWADDNPKPRTITRAEYEEAERRYWNYVQSKGDADLALLAAFHCAGIEVTDDE